MFAVIKTGGKQYRAQEGDVLQVEKLEVEKGQEVTFDQVLLIEDDGKALIGTPFVENAVVKAVVLEHFKDKKVIVFKKKRRKQYKKKRGHRQELTKVQIEKIITVKEKAPSKKPAVEKKAVKTKKPGPKASRAAVEKTAEPAKKKAPAPKVKTGAAKSEKPKAEPAAKPKTAAKPAAEKKKSASVKES